MAPSRILFRTWSSSSAGTNSRRGHRSGDKNPRKLEPFEIEEHFENHRDMDNRVPTCFISTTDDPVRALKLAMDLQSQNQKGIHIAIIQSNNYVCGEELASLLKYGNPNLLKTEFLFRWEIKASEIVHVVSLDALKRNGLLRKCQALNPKGWEGGILPSLKTIREEIYDNNEKAWEDGNENTWPERSGRYVAGIAMCFGNGAPHHAIASLIWDRGTHFEPENYEEWEMDLRVRDAIQSALKEVRSCRHDWWCGELANV